MFVNNATGRESFKYIYEIMKLFTNVQNYLISSLD